MRALLLCCLVALAVCHENFRYEINLDSRKIYEYQYDAQVEFGLENPTHPKSGARLKSKVKIVGHSPDTFLLQFSEVVFEEFNGFPDKDNFVAINELSRKLTAQLSKPILFRYSAGNVVEIKAPVEMSDTMVNIVKGVLGFFQLTVKTTQEIYELEEIGIHGKCLSSYAQMTNAKVGVMDLTQVVDVTNCREKAAYSIGLATAVEDRISKQRGETIFSTVKYTYNIRGSEQTGVIIKAEAVEEQLFSPHNVKFGNFRMEAKKVLLLIREEEKHQDVLVEQHMESRGNLMFKIVKDNANIPVVMQNVEDPVSEATKLIKHLALVNERHIDSTKTEEVMKLYQLLRMIPVNKLKEMWVELKSNPDQRYWFLHTVVEVNDKRILEFFEQYLSETDINTLEAVTVIVQAFTHLEASEEVLKLAEKFLIKNYNDALIRQTVVLSYGSLVYKHCAYHKPCPEAAIRPLLDMAEKAHSSDDEMEKILVLKALGNAGHRRSIKTITRFLPGVDPNPDQVDKRPRVVSAAVQALRLVTVTDPHAVQLITMKLFLNRELEAELRMLAFMIMVDTKPSMALVSTVTAHLLEERDMQVFGFVYTYLRSLASSTTPNNHYLSTAASVAVKILKRKSAHLSYIQSRAGRTDWFNDNLLIGAAAEAFMLKRASQLIPAEMMVKTNFHFIGRILQVVEIGVRLEGLRDLFGANIHGLNGDMTMADFQAIFDVLKKWETLPEDKPLFSFYTRASGQEFFYNDFSKNLLERATRELSHSAGRDSFLWRIMERLIQGVSWRGVLPFMIAEARLIQATTVGFPVEISKYYHVVSRMEVNAKAGMKPQVAENVGQLLSSELTMATDGYIGYAKNLFFFYGINTDFFKSAVEIKTVAAFAVPFDVVATMNIPARKFELEIPRNTRELEIISLRSNAYAITRNIIHPDMPKKTPIGSRDQTAIPNYSQVMLKIQPNRWHPRERVCSVSTIYGLAVCTEMELKREYYQEEYPLYYFLGSSHFALKVAPAQESVEKIRLEINANPSSSSVSVRQIIDALRKIAKEVRSPRDSGSNEQLDRPSRGIGGSPVPLVQVKLLAESRNLQKGYDTTLYYTTEEQKHSTQLIMSYIGDSSNWKMCVDAAVASEAKAHIGWGDQCQSYAMFMRAARVTGNRPELKAAFQWGNLPESFKLYGRRIASYIPGMAYLLGFNQEEKRNAVQEVSVSVIAASADSIDVKIKLPELSLCREALLSPVPPAYFLYSNRTINSITQS